MKIFFISTMASSPWAGSEELWIATARQAIKNGDSVSVSAFKWPDVSLPLKLRELADAGATMIWRQRYAMPTLDELAIKAANLLSGRIFSKHVALPSVIGSFGSNSVFRRIAKLSPDIICLNQGWPYDLLDAAGSRSLIRELVRSKVPYVIICHLNTDIGHPSEVLRKEVKQLYVGARCLAFVSNATLRATERQFAVSLPEARIVGNPVNIKVPTITKWPEPETVLFRFACVARLDVGQKGQDLLFETLSHPRWRARDNWELTLVGSGSDLNYLRELAAHFHLTDRIVFAGQSENICEVWEHHHLLLLPSRAEGAPLALVEAMLCGRPAVVTDVGGNAEWIRDGQNGFLAAAPTAASLNEALERAWIARDSWAVLGKRARDKALSQIEFDPGRKMLDLLQESARGR